MLDSPKATLAGQEHILPLTGLRAFGALAVVIYHFRSPEWTTFEPFLASIGPAGVMLFFSLSGYLLTHIYQEQFSRQMSARGYADFIWKRLARVYPLHLFLLFLTLISYPALVDPVVSGPRQLVAHLLLIHGWTFDKLSFVVPSWSISVEFFYYLIFPVCTVALQRRVSAPLFFALAVFMGMVSAQLVPVPEAIQPYVQHYVFSYGAYFILGCCAHRIAQNSTIKALLDTSAAFLVLFVLLIAVCFTFTPKMLALPFIIPTLVASAHRAPAAWLIMGNRPMVFLGDISYSIYMVHLVAYSIVLQTTNYGHEKDESFWISVILLTFIMSVGTYYFVERPARRWLRGLPTRSQPAPLL